MKKLFLKEVLLTRYNEELEKAPPTELDNILGYALGKLDFEASNNVFEATTDVINEQIKLAFMAGFNAGALTSRVAAS